MHGVAVNCVHSKDAQKQLAQMSLTFISSKNKCNDRNLDFYENIDHMGVFFNSFIAQHKLPIDESYIKTISR